MEEIKKALSYFVNKNMLDKDEFTDEVWQMGPGPALALLKKRGLVYAHSAAEEDFPIVGDLTGEGKIVRDRLFKK